MYIIFKRQAICLSCGLTHKIRNSFRTSGAGQLTGNGKTRITHRISGADQLTDNRKISHKRKDILTIIFRLLILLIIFGNLLLNKEDRGRSVHG